MYKAWLAWKIDLLVCHVVSRSVQDSYCTLSRKRHMTDKQIYFSGWPRFVHTCLGLIGLFWRYFYLKFENLKKGQNFVPNSKCFRCMYIILYPTKMLQVHVQNFVPDSKCFRCMHLQHLLLGTWFCIMHLIAYPDVVYKRFSSRPGVQSLVSLENFFVG